MPVVVSQCHLGMRVEIGIYRSRVYLFGFGEVKQVVLYPIVVGNHTHTFPVCSVGSDEQVFVIAYSAADGGLHTESPAALHQHRRVFVRAARYEFDKFPSYDLYDAGVVVFVPSTPVTHHGLLD